MHPSLRIFILTLLVVCSQQYALEGTWTLTNHADISLDPSAEVEFEFKTSIGNNNAIERRLEVSACYNLAYRYEVQDSGVYL